MCNTRSMKEKTDNHAAQHREGGIVTMPDYTENNFYVEKIETRVILMLDQGRPRIEECSVWLNICSRTSNVRESLKEFLENIEKFFPVKSKATGRISVMNSDAIIYLLEKEKVTLHSANQYSLVLKGKIKINVSQYVNLPKVGGRFLDILNQDENYVSFLFNGSRIHINKKALLRGSECRK